MIARILLTILFLSQFSCATSAQDAGAPMTAETLWKLKRVGGLTLSPDGTTAAVVVTTYDIATNKGNGDIWLIDIRSGDARQFTAGETTEGSPAWSADGKTIAFTSKRNDDEKSQLYLIPVDGGEARRITDMPMGVGAAGNRRRFRFPPHRTQAKEGKQGQRENHRRPSLPLLGSLPDRRLSHAYLRGGRAQ
jgi:dipeptidyl aminopeptidase/acylaminoacyl peptidase